MKDIVVSTKEAELVVKAAENYLKAFKEVRPELVRNYFLPQFTKIGYFYDYEKNEWMDLSIHSLQQVIDWAGTYNVNGIMPDSEATTTLLDLQDRTAVVKVEAEWAPGKWGNDYVMLAKQNEEWLISSILWQSIS
jgi:hypothetical protein